MLVTETLTPLPEALQEIADDFADLAVPQRLELLLEFSEGLPDLPEQYAGRLGEMEQVHECQSPLFLAVEVGDSPDGVAGKRPVHLFFSAPPEAPTTRGFASILVQGLEGLTVDEVLAVPDDFPQMIGLSRAVSPLRLRGMSALLGRAKRRLREFA